MKDEKQISIIIPNYNGAKTIGKCLETALSSEYKNFEVIVVDDCSTDNSVEIIKGFSCKLIQLDRHSGTSKARNVGAKNITGKALFFIDADCFVEGNAIALANKMLSEDENIIIGGTYTKIPYDDNFFSTFQSIFINYSETKHKDAPDYIATHAMIIDNQIFRDNGGFKEDFFIPVLEDVEFSHRLRRAGYRLVINPEILVQHIFSFSLLRSLQNAARKSMYWTIYSVKNRDLLADSGTASVELKTNILSYLLILLTLLFYLIYKDSAFLILITFIFGINVYVNKRLIKAFYETKGLFFTVTATLYYTLIYPLGVGAGAFAGVLTYLWVFRIKRSLR